MSRSRWVAGGVAAALVLAGAAALGSRAHHGRCGAAVTSLAAAKSSSPFLDAAGQRQQPDARRDALVAALQHGQPPLGPVLGAVGYDYDQWAQISAYAQGLGIRTRDNPDFTMLDDQTLRPRWSVQVGTARSTYDASATRYLVATLPARSAPDLVSLDADTGRRRWCAELGGPRVGVSDPFATQLLDDGGVVVLGPGRSGRERVVRLDAHGRRLWQRELAADRGAYLGFLGDGLLVAGGRAQYDLVDPTDLARRRAGAALVAIRPRDGSTAWVHTLPAGTDLSVIGVSGTTLLAQERTATRSRLVAYDASGRLVWSIDPTRGQAFDAALLAGRVLVRVGTAFSAYDATSGRALWRRTYSDDPQLLPYGFELDDVPLLDNGHVLLATTTALRVLDLDTGAFTSTTPLPTDGVSTTYWPYATAVTDHLVAIATNTSAVVLRRR